MSQSVVGKGNDPMQEKASTLLFEFLSMQVSENNAICPQGDQRYEVTRGRNHFINISSNLSHGTCFKPREIISDIQMHQFMKTFHYNTNEANISFIDVFIENPPIEISKIVFRKEDNVKYSKDYFRWRNKNQSDLETLRQHIVAKNISFSSQLETEYLGILQALNNTVNLQTKENESDLDQNKIDFGLLENYIRWLKYWYNLSGTTNNTERFIRFLYSDYIKLMPIHRIEANLTAKILTRKAPIKSGDAMDIDHISSILPYADYLFTDKSMKHLIKALKLDSLFECTVFYLGDAEEFISGFNRAK